jgi:drug/metabolite transporter (DMT)-like permease
VFDNVVVLVLALLAVDGLHFVFARALHDYLNPNVSVFFVMAIGTLEVAAYAAWRGQLKLATFLNHYKFFLAIGVLVAISTSINYSAVGFIDPGTASLLSETSILFGLVLGVGWLKDTLTRRQVLGASVALAGVAVITFQPGDYWRLGALLVIGSAGLYAMHAALVKRYGGGLEFAEFFVWRLAVTSGFLLISVTGQGLLAWPTDRRAWLIMLVAATVDIGVSRTLYYLALRRLTVSIHSLVLTLSPVVAILWSLVLFGVQPSLRELAGGAAVLAGVAIVTYRRFQTSS